MKERPINLAAEEVRAILDGRKTQLRRVAKLPEAPMTVGYGAPTRVDRRGEEYPGLDVFAAWGEDWHVKSPFGAPGERLYVRETWRPTAVSRYWPAKRSVFYVEYREQLSSRGAVRGYQHRNEWRGLSDEEHDALTRRTFAAGGRNVSAWRPSVHMPRWASRVTLEVTAVRVERLHGISEADAVAEGVIPVYGRDVAAAMGSGVETWKNYHDEDAWVSCAAISYGTLWQAVHGARSWRENPWVWVVEFKHITTK